MLAGVAGTAITADLGARKIREELDALQVLGVDPVKNLVVPRFLALMLVTGLFDIYALLFGIFGGMLATIVNDAPLGTVLGDAVRERVDVTDLWGSVLKTTLFGAIIAIVCCYKGMTASGGAEGVGRAVNEAVVIAFLGICAFNYVFTQTLLATHPQILVMQVMNELLDVPREWLAATGEIGASRAKSSRDVWSLRVFRFFGEALRQAGILIVCSTRRHLGARVHHRAGSAGSRRAYFNRGDRRARIRGRVRRLVRSA